VAEFEQSPWTHPEFCILPAAKAPTSGRLPTPGSARKILPGSIDFKILNGWLSYCLTHHGDTCELFPGYPRRLTNLKEDGDYHRLDEQAVSNINPQGALAIPYQPVVRIEAWTVRVRFRYIAGGFDDTKTPWASNHPDPTYFICAQVASHDASSHGTHYWSFVQSVQVVEGDDFHRALCEEEFACILLSKQTRFGMVCRKGGDPWERIGGVGLLSPHFEGPADLPDAGRDARPSYNDILYQDLFDCLPRKRETFLLG